MATEVLPTANVQPLPDFASADNWEVQREIEAFAARLEEANSRLYDEKQRSKAMEEHLRQMDMGMRQRQAQAEALRSEQETEAHLLRMLQQSDVRIKMLTFLIDRNR